MRMRLLVPALGLAAAGALGGCVAAAAGAAAGAGAATYVARGSSDSVVPTNIEEVAGWTTTAFADLGITQTESALKDGGSKRQFEGTEGDHKVGVSLESRPEGATAIRVTAKTSAVKYDKDYAEKVLAAILAKRGA